jgi:uncharacterized phage-associated protein
MNIDIEKVKNIALYLSTKAPQLFCTKFLKLLYYFDFIAVQETGKPVTNDVYFHLPYGPIPSFIKDHVDLLDPARKKSEKEIFLEPSLSDKSYETQSIFEGILELKEMGGGKIIKQVDGKVPDLDQLSGYEKGLLDDLINDLGALSVKDIVEKTHKEAPYVQTVSRNVISYEMAFQLDIKTILSNRNFIFDKELSLARYKSSC